MRCVRNHNVDTTLGRLHGIEAVKDVRIHEDRVLVVVQKVSKMR